jgi:hypothetical protein
MAMDAKKLKQFAERDGKGGGGDKAKPFGKKGQQPGQQKPDEATHDEPDEDDLDDDEEDENESDDEIAARVGAQVAAGKTDPDLMDHLDGYDPETDGNPPAWVNDEATWERAKNAVEKSWDDYDQPYAVVAHVYKAMGGEVG